MITKVTTFNLFLPSRVYFFDSSNAQNKLINQYGEGLKTVIDTVFTIAPIFSGGNVPNSIISRLAKGLNFKGDKTTDDLQRFANPRILLSVSE